MNRRLELQEKLETLLGSNHVYFQPPETVKLVYPCILYVLRKIDLKQADNYAYFGKRKYAVTLISSDPDFAAVEEMTKFPLCSFDRFFTADNLNHWVYELYY